MQVFPVLFRRGVCPAAVLVCSGLFVADMRAEMPVKQVILYKHGLGFFSREGTVGASEDVRLDFQNTEMNDVLKSLTVAETSGGRITAVRYDSNETPEQRLQKFPFQLGDGQFLTVFLDSLKGSRIQLTLPNTAATGCILGARAFEAGPEGDKRVSREQITLMLDSGEIASYDLSAVSSLRLLEARLQQQLKDYLQTVAQSRSREKRSVYIEAAGSGERHLQASYIAPTAIWKSSYRLTLHNPSSTLEGWAIVDNTTDEDWNNVRLSVVSGRPISFVSLLDTPRYGQRQVAELPEDRAAGPVVYGGAVGTLAKLQRAPDQNGFIGRGQGSGFGAGVGGGTGGGVYRPGAGLPLNEQTRLEAQASSVEGATGATLGELFEYNFAGPVTIKKNQSAMLPFLQDKV